MVCSDSWHVKQLVKLINYETISFIRTQRVLSYIPGQTDDIDSARYARRRDSVVRLCHYNGSQQYPRGSIGPVKRYIYAENNRKTGCKCLFHGYQTLEQYFWNRESVPERRSGYGNGFQWKLWWKHISYRWRGYTTNRWCHRPQHGQYADELREKRFGFYGKWFASKYRDQAPL